MVRGVAETGYAATSVQDVISLAGVSRRAFYEHYENKQQCFLAACEDVVRDWMTRAARLYSGAVPARAGARARLRAALRTLCELVESDPLGARLLLVETPNCGIEGVRRLDATTDQFEGAVTRSLSGSDSNSTLSPGLATVIIGGVLGVIAARVRDRRTDELPGLIDPVTDWALAYRSAKAARALTQARRQASLAAENARTQARGSAGEGSDDPVFALWRDPTLRPVTASDALARIVRATVQLVDERGFAALSVGEIVREARVSYRTFRKHFGTSEDAFLAAYRAGNQETIEHALRAYAGAPDWPTAVHAGLAAQLQFLAERPELARIGFVEVYSAGPRGIALRDTEMRPFMQALQPGYRTTERNTVPHPVTSELILNGLDQLFRSFLLHDRAELLTSLSAEASYAALAPFLGAPKAVPVATGAAQRPTGHEPSRSRAPRA
jgi:AcrR family transcriptional regulator